MARPKKTQEKTDNENGETKNVEKTKEKSKSDSKKTAKSKSKTVDKHDSETKMKTKSKSKTLKSETEEDTDSESETEIKTVKSKPDVEIKSETEEDEDDNNDQFDESIVKIRGETGEETGDWANSVPDTNVTKSFNTRTVSVNRNDKNDRNVRQRPYKKKSVIDFDYKKYETFELPTSDLTTDDILKFLIVRSHKNGQTQLCSTLKQTLRACNFEANFPEFRTQYSNKARS